MERWMRRQSWQEKQCWSTWMSSPTNRHMLARAVDRKLRAAQVLKDEQACLFV
jgi:hypothetical protein